MKSNSDRGLYLLPPVLFLICITGMIILGVFWPYHSLYQLPYNLLGVPLLLTGIAISMWGSDKFRKLQTNIHTFKEPDKLVVDGLYKYSRNPMYLGFSVSLLGMFIILGTASPVILLFLFFIITDQWYIKFEERMLLKKFGGDYQEYKAATRRWI